MFRIHLCIALFLMAGLISAAQTGKDAQDQSGKKQQATITKVDAKKGTVTVRMKDKSGKEVERVFKLTGDIRYFDSTGKAVAVDFFQSGDDVLVVEAEGRLRELHRGQGSQGFLRAAAEINMTEMKLGQLAQDRASAPAIKKLGERLVTDHAKMNKDLTQLAKSHDVTLPEKLDKMHQKLVDQLQNLKGTEFDKAFAKDMVAGHEKAIHRFESEAKNGQDSEVKAWAERWLPALRAHLELAKTAATEVK